MGKARIGGIRAFSIPFAGSGQGEAFFCALSDRSETGPIGQPLPETRPFVTGIS
jgi:hypothetical protein